MTRVSSRVSSEVASISSSSIGVGGTMTFRPGDGLTQLLYVSLYVSLSEVYIYFKCVKNVHIYKKVM